MSFQVRHSSIFRTIEANDKQDLVRKVLNGWLQRSIYSLVEKRKVAFNKLVENWKNAFMAEHCSNVAEFIENFHAIIGSDAEIGRSAQDLSITRSLLLGPKLSHNIFRKLKDKEIEKVCEEVKSALYTERTILFLQGHRGESTYYIASGTVDLFCEESLEQELLVRQRIMSNVLRGHENPAFLGKYIKSLSCGTLFGDLVMLGGASSGRSCTAVVSAGSLLFVLNKHTYITVLHPYRAPESNIIDACMLLKESILFSTYSASKLKNVAYIMTSKEVPCKTVIAQAGSPITAMFLIVLGDVKMYADDQFLSPSKKNDSSFRLLHAAVAQISRGTIIGERETVKRSSVFQMTYVAISRCRVFELPMDKFDHLVSPDKERLDALFHSVQQREKVRDAIYVSRVAASRAAMNSVSRAMEPVSHEWVKDGPRHHSGHCLEPGQGPIMPKLQDPPITTVVIKLPNRRQQSRRVLEPLSSSSTSPYEPTEVDSPWGPVSLTGNSQQRKSFILPTTSGTALASSAPHADGFASPARSRSSSRSNLEPVLQALSAHSATTIHAADTKYKSNVYTGLGGRSNSSSRGLVPTESTGGSTAVTQPSAGSGGASGSEGGSSSLGGSVAGVKTAVSVSVSVSQSQLSAGPQQNKQHRTRTGTGKRQHREKSGLLPPLLHMPHPHHLQSLAIGYGVAASLFRQTLLPSGPTSLSTPTIGPTQAHARESGPFTVRGRGSDTGTGTRLGMLTAVNQIAHQWSRKYL